MKTVIIGICGGTASGKTSVVKALKDKGLMGLPKVTTRPRRPGEKDGEDYIFVTDSEFDYLENAGEFLTVENYREWRYAIPKSAIATDRTTVQVLTMTPSEAIALKRSYEYVILLYLNVPRRDRLIKVLQRGDDIEEAYRRNLSDEGQFSGINAIANAIVDNPGYHLSPSEIAEMILGEVIGDDSKELIQETKPKMENNKAKPRTNLNSEERDCPTPEPNLQKNAKVKKVRVCPICEGSGVIKFFNIAAKCGRCNGYGRLRY